MKNFEKNRKKKSFGFGKKNFGTDTDTFGQIRRRYRISVVHYHVPDLLNDGSHEKKSDSTTKRKPS